MQIDGKGLAELIRKYTKKAMKPYMERSDQQREDIKELRDEVMYQLGVLSEGHELLSDDCKQIGSGVESAERTLADVQRDVQAAHDGMQALQEHAQLADDERSAQAGRADQLAAGLSALEVQLDERMSDLSSSVAKTQQSLPDIDELEQRLVSDIADLRDNIPGADAIKSAVLEDVQDHVAALEVPDDRIDAAIERHAAKMELALERRFNDLVERAYDRLPKPDDVRAVESMEVRLLDDERTLEIDLGVYGRKQVKLAHPVYRGVWGDGGYDKGDTVTWAGSTWIAERDTTGKPGAKDSGWRLSVKKGRDGQDGAPGKIPEGERLTAREVKTLRALLAKHEERNQ